MSCPEVAGNRKQIALYFPFRSVPRQFRPACPTSLLSTVSEVSPLPAISPSLAFFEISRSPANVLPAFRPHFFFRTFPKFLLCPPAFFRPRVLPIRPPVRVSSFSRFPIFFFARQRSPTSRVLPIRPPVRISTFERFPIFFFAPQYVFLRGITSSKASVGPRFLIPSRFQLNALYIEDSFPPASVAGDSVTQNGYPSFPSGLRVRRSSLFGDTRASEPGSDGAKLSTTEDLAPIPFTC